MTTSPKLALVTGANKGIGFEISRQLAEADVRVLLGARDTARGTQAAQALAAQGLDVSFLKLDLAEEAEIAAAAAAIGGEHGRLDILVNNAGIVDPEDGPPTAASLAAIRRILETNFLGTVAVTQAMLPLLRAADSGRIVNLSSALGSLDVNGDRTSPYFSARLLGYNASKAAVNMLTVQLDAELGDGSITVNSVSPGYARTDLTGGEGFMTAAEAGAVTVRYALADGEVSGRSVGPDGELPW